MENAEGAVGTINRTDVDWLRKFDEVMRRFSAINHADAGMDARELCRYADLPPDIGLRPLDELYDFGVELSVSDSALHEPGHPRLFHRRRD